MSNSIIRNSESMFNVEENVENFIIEGRAVVYNQIANIGNKYLEVILPTALDNCDLSDVCLLVNHDANVVPLARYRQDNEDSTLELIKKEDGLYFRARLDPQSPAAQDLISALRNKNIDKMSFRFSLILNDENVTIDNTLSIPTRYIKHIQKISEISVVTWPAYSDTSAYLRSVNNESDDDFEEYQLKKQKQKEEEHKLFIAKMLALY